MTPRWPVRLGFLALTAVVWTSCGGSEDAEDAATRNSEPTWCGRVEEFREDWIQLNDAWLDDEMTFEEREAAAVEMVEAVRDEVPPEIRESFEQVMLGELEGEELEAGLRAVLKYEEDNCNRGDDAEQPVTPTEVDPQLTDLQKYCHQSSIDFAEHAGGRQQVYEDLVRYAPPEIRAHEALVLGHLAEVVGEDVQFEGIEAATGPAPDNVMDSIDVIEAFREEHC